MSENQENPEEQKVAEAFLPKPSLAYLTTDQKPAFDAKNFGAGVESAAKSKNKDLLAILGDLRLMVVGVADVSESEIKTSDAPRAHIITSSMVREQLHLIDELHAALDRESIKAQLQSLKDQGIQEGLKLAKQLAKASFGPQLKESLLDICREFDGIDLSECNRRLEAGEPFDAACDEAMEKRQALGEKIKERLGADWVTFEAYAEIATPRDSAEAALWNLAGDVCAALAGFIADEVDDLARRNLTRLGVLLS